MEWQGSATPSVNQLLSLVNQLLRLLLIQILRDLDTIVSTGVWSLLLMPLLLPVVSTLCLHGGGVVVIVGVVTTGVSLGATVSVFISQAISIKRKILINQVGGILAIRTAGISFH